MQNLLATYTRKYIEKLHINGISSRVLMPFASFDYFYHEIYEPGQISLEVTDRHFHKESKEIFQNQAQNKI